MQANTEARQELIRYIVENDEVTLAGSPVSRRTTSRWLNRHGSLFDVEHEGDGPPATVWTPTTRFYTQLPKELDPWNPLPKDFIEQAKGESRIDAVMWDPWGEHAAKAGFAVTKHCRWLTKAGKMKMEMVDVGEEANPSIPSRWYPDEMDEWKVLASMEGDWTVKELAEEAGVDQQLVRGMMIEPLVEEVGERAKVGRGRNPTVYTLTEEGRRGRQKDFVPVIGDGNQQVDYPEELADHIGIHPKQTPRPHPRQEQILDELGF